MMRTISQSETPERFEARQKRITASRKAHQIKTMTRTTAAKLLNEFLNQ